MILLFHICTTIDIPIVFINDTRSIVSKVTVHRRLKPLKKRTQNS